MNYLNVSTIFLFGASRKTALLTSYDRLILTARYNSHQDSIAHHISLNTRQRQKRIALWEFGFLRLATPPRSSFNATCVTHKYVVASTINISPKHKHTWRIDTFGCLASVIPWHAVTFRLLSYLQLTGPQCKHFFQNWVLPERFHAQSSTARCP